MNRVGGDGPRKVVVVPHETKVETPERVGAAVFLQRPRMPSSTNTPREPRERSSREGAITDHGQLIGAALSCKSDLAYGLY